jgi:hypothetical protein
MDARFDTPFESWGGFSTTTAVNQMIYGRLKYRPDNGVELELVENPQGIASLGQGGAAPIETIYGQLVDGTRVTLSKCFVTQSSIQIGVGIGEPTALTVNRAIFRRHVEDLDKLQIKKYSLTLSSLANWTCTEPVSCEIAPVDGKPAGFDVTCRLPSPIDIPLPDRGFDLQIGHGMKTNKRSGSFSVRWEAAVTVSAHESMAFEEMHEIAWQCQNLLSLLIGHRISVREITVTPTDAKNGEVPEPPLQLVYRQIGKHDHPDVHPALMLLPYDLVKSEIPQMVDRWFARSAQAVLATNIFFGSNNLQSPAVNVKFLAAAQAAESYHRSLGSGLYMNQAAFDAAIQEFLNHIPAAIQGDNRVSLKNRLKYGNEHSLRKRLRELLTRLPENVGTAIATDLRPFISKVVDTRNYYTHYDHASEANAFEPKASYVAAERLRVLVTASLLHDLGVSDNNLLSVLQRSQDFQHWMSQPLPL